ncbi:MAG: 23S rRNA (pseudouridine(1915)-N(3))-methyltransferase RlmH [Deltaproteobacteria bacterium]|nr:23S rRNA (pseudouridine(1915)-N(3))-methyltransferase RlmH [Deltaproteobacteria bacterium]
MPRIRIIVVDRTRSEFLREGEAYYLQRLRRYIPVEWIEVKPVKIQGNRPSKDIIALEGKRIQEKRDTNAHMVVLDGAGRQYDSLELAEWIGGLFHRGVRSIEFIVGGPLGLSDEVSRISNEALSLSRLTLTHEMCRLVLLEQLYRAMTILRGEKYHK